MRITVKRLIEIIARLDRYDNMMQVCYIFDGLPKDIRDKVEELRNYELEEE